MSKNTDKPSEQDDALFRDKLELLQIYYPEVDASVLGELLAACNGSIPETKNLIGGQGSEKPQTIASPPTLYQGSVEKLVQSPKPSLKTSPPPSGRTMPKHQPRIITLHTPEQVDKHLAPYASLHRKFLPQDLATQLLQTLYDQRDKITPNKFHLFENDCVSNHASSLFHRPENTAEVIYNGLSAKDPERSYDSIISATADIVSDFINNTAIPSTPKLPFQTDQPWDANACIINYYESHQNNLEWHSDKLSYIGPHNYIVSLSVGASRYFRLRRNNSTTSTIYQVALPHNTLIIMKPGCQELFKHCINPLTKPLQVHPLVGGVRFNLTFRFQNEHFAKNVPHCKCGLPMTLRRSYKNEDSKKGRYFWSCDNIYQDKECGTFHWADFNNVEGKLVATKTENISVWLGD